MGPRISAALSRLQGAGEAALVGYVMAGYPSYSATMSAVSGMIRGGADIIELGVPFSDPLADGPVIQDAGTGALKKGANMRRLLGTVRKIRRISDIPLVLMTYSNVPYRRGYGEFAAEAADAGIDGLIIPDMPVEEAAEYRRAARGRLETIFLASPNTGAARIRRIAGASGGFMYLVAVYGTTGSETGVKDYAVRAVRRAKRHAGIPVGVGFGISAPADVRRYVGAGADAVIVGSAFMRIIEGSPGHRIESRVASFARSLKRETLPGRRR